MSTTTVARSSAPHRPTTGLRSAIASLPVWVVGAGATLVAALVTTLCAVVAKAMGVPLEAAPQNADGPEELPMMAFAFGVVMSGAVGVALALALYRWAKRPARTFVAVTVVLTVVSFATPLTTGHATTATRVVLELTHVVAAALVIPPIAHRLAQRPTRA